MDQIRIEELEAENLELRRVIARKNATITKLKVLSESLEIERIEEEDYAPRRPFFSDISQIDNWDDMAEIQ